MSIRISLKPAESEYLQELLAEAAEFNDMGGDETEEEVRNTINSIVNKLTKQEK